MTPAAHTIPFAAKLQRLADHHGIDRRDVDEVAGLRVSTKSTQALTNQASPDGALAANPAVKAFLASHEQRLIAGDDAELARHHIVRVNEGDLAPGYISGARVGYAAFSQNPDTMKWTVVLAVANSAVLRRLPSKESTGGLSAWIQMVTWTWAWADACRRLRFVRDDRMARDLEVFAPINGRVKERAGGAYWWGAERIDPHRDNWRAIIGAQTSSVDAVRSKGRLLNGRANAWARGEWTEKAEYLPVGLHLPEVVDEHGVTCRSKIPAVDPVMQPIVQRMFEHAALGWKWAAIAADAAADGATNGRGAYLALMVAPYMNREQRERARQVVDRHPGPAAEKLRDALDKADGAVSKAKKDRAARAAIEFCKRTFQQLDSYRHGQMWKMHVNTLPGSTRTDDHLFTFIIDDERLVPDTIEKVFTAAEYEALHPGHPLWRIRASDSDYYAEICQIGFVDAQIKLPTPVTLSEEQWGAVAAAVPDNWLTGKRTGRPRKESSEPTAPLSQLSWTTEDDSWVIWQDHGAYEFLRGKPGAKADDMNRVGRVPCSIVHRAVGTWWVELAQELDEAIEPLPVLQAATPDVAAIDPIATAEVEVAQLETELAQKERTLQGALRDRAGLDPDNEGERRRYERYGKTIAAIEDEIDVAEQSLAAAVTALEQATAGAATRPSSPEAETDDSPVDVDANPLIAIGARLCKLADEQHHLDVPETSAALAWMLNNGQLLDVRFGEGRDLHLEVKGIRVPGRTVPQLLSGRTFTFTSTKGRLRGKATDPTLPNLAEEAARWALAEHKATEFRSQHNWSYPFLVEVLRDWLQDHGLAPGAVNAIISATLVDDPRIPVGPTVYAWLTTAGKGKARRAAAEAAGARLGETHMVDPIIDAYIHHGNAWPQRGTGWVRRPLSDTRKLVGLLAAQCSPRSRRADVAKALDIPKAELRTLIHVDRPLHAVDADHHHVGAKACPRTDCPNGMMSIVLAVPEVMLLHDPKRGAVVACDTCHRPAGTYWDARPLTAVYRERWDTPSSQVNQQDPAARCYITDPTSTAATRMPEPTYSMSTAAKKLGIARSSLSRLIDDGILPAEPVRNRRGGHRIPESALHDPTVLAAASALRERRYEGREEDRPVNRAGSAGGSTV